MQAKGVQASLLLLAEKLAQIEKCNQVFQDKLLDKLSETLLATVAKLTNSLYARYENLGSRVQTMWMMHCVQDPELCAS